MKIVIAPDSFKESLSSLEVAKAIERGVLKKIPEARCIKVPLADGGEGTVASIIHAKQGKLVKVEVSGPMGELVKARFGLIDEGKTAVIEMAEAAGLHLVPETERNPMHTTTYGVGEMLIEALERGVTKIILGVGGSATNDGGVGLLQALGISFMTKDNKEIGRGGKFLGDIYGIDETNIHPRLCEITLKIASDVKTPFIGPDGATRIFGPQKGGTHDMIETLERNLVHFASVIREYNNCEINEQIGGGAAGGLPGGMMAFLDVEIVPGIDLIIETIGLSNIIKDVDLIITGEGKIDRQSLLGKTPYGVAQVAKLYDIPVIAIAGSISNDLDANTDTGLTAIYTIVPHITDLYSSMTNPAYYIEELTGKCIKKYSENCMG